MRRALLVAILILLAACGSQRPEPATLTGEEGVVLTLIDTPAEVYENEEFPVIFELENRGITDVSEDDPGRIFLSHDKLYLEYLGSVSRYPRDEFWLDARSRYVPGENTYYTARFRARPIDRFSESVQTQLLVSTCYPYQSNVTAAVCIEQDRIADAGAIVCRNQPLRPPSPGAPIGVDLVETRSVTVPDAEGGGVRPVFRIRIVNYGRGTPALGSCLDDGLQEESNTLLVYAYLLDEPLECDRQAVSLIRGEAMVQCRLPDARAVTRGGGNFQSLLSIYLDYTYRETESIDVRVER